MWPNFKTPTKQAPLKTLLIHLLTMCRCIKAEKGGKVGSGRWEVGSGKLPAIAIQGPENPKGLPTLCTEALNAGTAFE